MKASFFPFHGRRWIGVVGCLVVGILAVGLLLIAGWNRDKRVCGNWFSEVSIAMSLGDTATLLKKNGANVVINNGESLKAYPSILPACYLYVEAKENIVRHVSVRSSDKFEDIWQRKDE